MGIALFLTHLAKLKSLNEGLTVSALRSSYPNYFMAKEKIALSSSVDLEKLMNQVARQFENEKVSRIDGVKIDFKESWVHMRKSNTEPIVRIYTEAKSIGEAEALASRFVNQLSNLGQ